MNTNSAITRLTGPLAATNLSTNLALALSAVSLAALATACGSETDPSDPVTRSDNVAEAAQNYGRDPWEQRFPAVYSDRVLSDSAEAWTRRLEALQHRTAGPYDQDPDTSAEAWTRRLEAVQGTSD
ncbi:hypothetical protein [Nocardioides guangzhouensis]|uniref:hypothetical protein n=1 Tax=Nocardioides guangzhouensis TaxID=2497878 RepID=UPI0014382F01|nr:hypothetical protein [Nocardioides guangzhouensis]